MSLALYTGVCAGIPHEKNLDWQSNPSGRGYGMAGQSEQSKVMAVQIGNKKAKRESLVFDRRPARAKAQKPAGLLVLSRSRAHRVFEQKAP